MSDMVALLNVSEKSKEFKEALRVYNEFKSMREKMGKPIESALDPKKIKKDLTGDDFYSLLEIIQKKSKH